MSDDLLPYYDSELSFLRELGADFARAHPKIAGRLRLSADAIEDPHVSRLIESVAFLNARIRKKLDDDLPEVTDALLGTLGPHHLAPIPSMAIVQFECDPELTAAYEVPAGAQLETDRAYGTTCAFRTVYPVKTWPVRMIEARLLGAPFQAPAAPPSSAAVLKLAFQVAAAQCPVGELGIDRLRLFLRGQPARVQALYELLLEKVDRVVVASSARDDQATVLGPEVLRPVGFEPDEGILPYSGRTPHGHRLMTEFFTFPAKFHFVDLTGLAPGSARAQDQLDVYVYLRESSVDLEQSVDLESFGLGCTPVVNLYQRRAEPKVVDQEQAQVHLLPDSREPEAHEIFSIDSVSTSSRGGQIRDYEPFFGLDHSFGDESEFGGWWYASRMTHAEQDREAASSEIYLALVDRDFERDFPDDWVLEANLTCLNRNLPARLPFSGDEPRMHFVSGGGGIKKIRCLTPPTQRLQAAVGRGLMWKVVSQLSLNHLSLTGGDEGGGELREILRVHDRVESPVTKAVIDSIERVESRASMIRVVHGDGLPGMVRGLKVRVSLDDDRLRTSGMLLFSSVLRRFLASLCSINSFVQLETVSGRRGESVRSFDPLTGDQALV